MAAVVAPIPAAVADDMRGASWHPDDPRCPKIGQLRLVRVRHVTFDGGVADGELVVAAEVADAVAGVFDALLAARFPIERVDRIDRYGGDDGASMAANNTSAFCFRTIAGTDRLSNHALGLAVDINPVQNPWIRGGLVLPAAGRGYLDRADVRPGMIVRPGPVTDAFDAIGWEWGGDWTDTRDLHHFAATPR